MRTVRFGPGVALFLIFFGLALIEAFMQADWRLAGVFLGLGVLFVVADNLPPRRETILIPPAEVEHEDLIPSRRH